MKSVIVLGALIVMAIACRKKDQTVQCTYVPSYVDTTINLNEQPMRQLQTKGYVFLKGAYRGIIVHKESDTEYRAFERSSTYKMAESGCQLLADTTSSFFLFDPCSKSKFGFDGNVMQGPATCPLLEFRTSFVGNNYLRIYYSN